MPPLSICNDRAFLISPLEVPVYILELPSTPKGPLPEETFIEGEIGNQLKALYPGTPADTIMDYTLYRPQKRDRIRQFNTVAVFVCSRPVHEIYRNLKRPLIPGIALMAEGMHNFNEKTMLTILCTPQWIEAAFFEDDVIRRYGSCPMGADGLPLTLITPFLDGPESGDIPALLIIAGSGEEQNRNTKKALNQLFKRLIDIDINEISIKKKIKILGIFSDNKGRTLIRRKRDIKLLAALNCISLLLSLHLISGEKNTELSRLENYYQEQNRRQNEVKRLEGEINELLSHQTREPQVQDLYPYEIISKIRDCLSGTWIRSLAIQEENFNMEAEGPDSIGVLQSMQASGYFSGLTIHQASPLKNSMEQFTISGRVKDHEK
ncbi:hypothetical protein [Treponema primitia]|uniref:hypothetical protein n=1 Tax=Treponema primitia TaxID=88058 RepID=UPI00025555C2|nr:hypothetical protein [Treponema primitia]